MINNFKDSSIIKNLKGHVNNSFNFDLQGRINSENLEQLRALGYLN